MKNLGAPVLCYVTDRNGLPGIRSAGDFSDRISPAVTCGVDWVQIREKDMSSPELCEIARALTLSGRKAGMRQLERCCAKIIVNDRLDVALAAGAAGVHLGGESLRVAEINKLRATSVFPERFLVGASCHSLEDVREAERDGADYVFFGPVFTTPSKEKFGAPQGIERLAETSRSVKIPVIAIGGITAENAASCVRAGAAGVAAIRMFQEAENLQEMVRALRERMRQTATGIGN